MTGIASTIGHAIRGIRPGLGAATTSRLGLRTISLRSTAFEDHGTMPARFTGDGDGLSPPLQWSGLPEGTRSLALLVEDVDAPFPRPLVHLVLYAMPPTLNGLAEGMIAHDQARSRMFTAGRTSFGRRGWLPPGPVPGHGPHRYVFQIIALDRMFAPRRVAGRGALRIAMRQSAIGIGRLIGCYERP